MNKLKKHAISIGIAIGLFAVAFWVTRAYAFAPTLVDIKDYAYDLVGEEQWYHFDYIISHESGWNYQAQNPTSSAYGLCQRMMSIHTLEDDYRTNMYTQINWCISYMEDRYGSIEEAYNFWVINSWY